MKQPIFESSPGALDALLFAPGPRNWAQADLYTITLESGPVLKYSTIPAPIAFDAQLFPGRSILVDDPKQKALAHWKTGLDIDVWQVRMSPRPRDDSSGALYPDLIGSNPWLAAVFAGALDGADAAIDRAYFPRFLPPSLTPYQPTGVLPLFRGNVAKCDVGRSSAVVTMNSYTDRLGNLMPRNLYQFGCVHTLFGPGCNVAGSLPQASFAVAGTVAGGSDDIHIHSAIGAPAGSGTYALGQIIFSSGANNGFSRMVRSWASGILTLKDPLYFDVTPGDTFTAYPGCDKRRVTCDLFGNILNFGGDPNTPVPEAAV